MIARLVFAHGAGNDKDSEFMQQCQGAFRALDIDCVLFNFDYMDKAKELGKRRPPDRMPKLLDRFASEVGSAGNELPLFIGGKSMGGRVASHLLETCPAAAAICFGYPFHPPGKPENLRVGHLQEPGKPILIVQGERDPFGKKEEIASYSLDNRVKTEYLANGEHSFKTRKSDPNNFEQNLGAAVSCSADFIKTIIGKG